MIDKLDGIYRAIVLDNQDPYNQERLLVQVDSIHEKDIGVWAEHISYSNRTSGDIPNVGDKVFVMFIKDFNFNYNPNDCVWIGLSNYK
jgi:hypothetical protein